MEGKTNKHNGFKPCWEYYKCSKESMKVCPAYSKGHNCEKFSDCWFYVNDAIQGGPEQHGPCAYCEWNKKHGFYKLQLDNYIKEKNIHNELKE